MLQFWGDFATNLAANIATAIVLGSVGLILTLRARGRGVKAFFGFSPGATAQQRIYLSTIAVKKGGTTGTGPIREGFHGDAITEIEYRHAFELASIFANRSLSWVAATLLGLSSAAENIVTRIEQSPSYREGIARNDSGEIKYDESVYLDKITKYRCVILIGAPIYNVLTHLVFRWRPSTQQRPAARVEFIRSTEDGTSVRGFRFRGEEEVVDYLREELPVEGEGVSPRRVIDYFVVEKLSIGKTKVFVCAGTCTAATAAAVDNLRANWKQYASSFGQRDF